MNRFAVMGVLIFTLVCLPAFAQGDDVSEATYKTLIEKLGDEDFQTREAAEEELLDLGLKALPFLRSATESKDLEVSLRAQRIIKKLTELTNDEILELREKGTAALAKGEHRKAISIYERLSMNAGSTFEDVSLLGASHQLSGNWVDAAKAYHQLISKYDRQIELSVGDESSVKVQRLNFARRRAAVLLLTARIERMQNDDLAAAEKTLRQIYKHTPLVEQSFDKLRDSWTERLKADHDGRDRATAEHSSQLHIPFKVLQELAVVLELRGKHAEAMQTLYRVHLLSKAYTHGNSESERVQRGRLMNEIQPLDDKAKVNTGLITLTPAKPELELNLDLPAHKTLAVDGSQNTSMYSIAAPVGQEFATLEFTVDIEQFKDNYGGQFAFWTVIGKKTPTTRNPRDERTRREAIKKGRKDHVYRYVLDPGIAVGHISVASWEHSFITHKVSMKATFRPLTEVKEDPKRPIRPGYMVNVEFLPKGGELLMNGKKHTNASTSHNREPGHVKFEYTHPDYAETKTVEYDFESDARYTLFVNMDSPWQSEITNLHGVAHRYGSDSSFVQLPSGRWLQVWIGEGLNAATSEDLKTWSAPKPVGSTKFYNDYFNVVHPTLFVDKKGVVWLAYFSNRLDTEKGNTGGYQMFLTHSTDAEKWAPPRIVPMQMSGWPPGRLQLKTGPDGKVWMFYRNKFAVGDSVDELGELKDLPLEIDRTAQTHAFNPQVVVGDDGAFHLVWDHFAMGLWYARRSPKGEWQKPVKISVLEDGRRARPHLILNKSRAALLFSVANTTHMMIGEMKEDGPVFGEPIKIAHHSSPLNSDQLRAMPDGRIGFFAASDTAWLCSVKVSELFPPADAPEPVEDDIDSGEIQIDSEKE